MTGQEIQSKRPTLGVLAGWQFYRSATTLNYLAPIFRGICRAAQETNCNILIGCGLGLTANVADLARPAWPEFAPNVDFVPIGPWNTDGLLVVNPLHLAECTRYMQQIMNDGHPVLFIGSIRNGPTISANNREGTLAAMRHLVAHGHERIAFLVGSPDDLDGDSGDRLRAYQEAVQRWQLADDPRLTVYGRHIYDGGYAAAQQLLASGVAFTALLASNDESAIGAMDALRAAGRRIPEDVAVVGFDDRLEGTVQTPALTTVRIPLFDMGYRAVRLMVGHLDGRQPLEAVTQVDTRLIRRQSCGCTPSSTIPAEADSTKSGDVPRSIVTAINTQARSLTEDECAHMSEQLMQAFTESIESDNVHAFQQGLEDILRQTAAAGNDVNLWQEAVSILATTTDQTEKTPQLDTMLQRARLTISEYMERQHREYVVYQRWIANRLGLLTADLLTALDEPQVFGHLSKHLRQMNISTSLIGLFESDTDWTMLHDATQPDRPPVRYPTQSFPPAGCLPDDAPYQLALLPLTQPDGQTGFVAFDTDHLDFYGNVAQQIAGALNAARLYRAAVEGKRLAEEANALKSRFLSTVSHELRTPLNIIVGLSSILLGERGANEHPRLPENVRHDVERIHSQAHHLGGLIGDVLDLASSDARQLRLNNETTDLVQALRLVAETGRQLAAEKGLRWNVSLPESSVWVWGDRVRLRQVALNLISNAVKFTAQGSVALNLEADGQRVTLSVVDSGLGISPEDQRHIFDEFRQAERTVARGFGGLGLGLAICKRLIELHRGEIGVRSTGLEGEGATFYFTLPIVQPPITHPPELATSIDQTVLLLTVPGETSQRLHHHLSARGFDVQVMTMDDSAGWQKLIIETPPGAIILDAGAPAPELQEVMRNVVGNPTTQGIPVLFYAVDQENGAMLELDYLTKPIRFNELQRALERVLPSPPAVMSGRTFLVVDDDPNTLEMHIRIVQAQSAANRILKARNGRDALQILAEHTVDLVLLDLMMPELDGFGVLEAMREQEHTRNTPVIILTGRSLTEDDMARLNRGVSTVLSKGVFSADETIAHITTALEHKRKLGTETQRLVRQAMAYLHQHYAEPVSRYDLARHVGLVEDYLTHCFRQELGMTPIAYLNRYRITQAKRLLRETDQSITEIALTVGFSDSSYFSRVFRRETGLSPDAFRRA
jgi:signal transduction histidine kinase/AraC-like DNA-binding protein/ABC-type sugar transport system substrate-binding protein